MNQDIASYAMNRDKRVLDALRKHPALKGFNKTKSAIISRALIKNNETMYELPVRKVDGSYSLPQILIPKEDVFVVLRIKYGLVSEHNDRPATGILHTYPNPDVFGGATTASHLESFWNGTMRVQMDDAIVADPIPTLQYRYVPQTQQVAVLRNEADDNNVGVGIAHSQYSHYDGLRELEPGLVINGLRKTMFELKIKQFASGTPNWGSSGADIGHYVQLYLEGFKVSSAAEKHYDTIVGILQSTSLG